MSRLKGVQLILDSGTRFAYRARTANGSLVLCDRHLDLLRAEEPATLTGEAFPAGLCDRCIEEEKL